MSSRDKWGITLFALVMLAALFLINDSTWLGIVLISGLLGLGLVMFRRKVRQFAFDFTEAKLQKQIDDNREEVFTYFEENSELLYEPFRQLFRKGRALQQAGQLGAVFVLSITFERQAILDNRYHLRLDLYDQAEADEVTCSENWDAGFIFKYIDSDLDAMDAEFTQKWTAAERLESKTGYMFAYIDVAENLWTQHIAEVLALEEWQQLQKTADYKVVFGEYQNPASLQIIYDAKLQQ